MAGPHMVRRRGLALVGAATVGTRHRCYEDSLAEHSQSGCSVSPPQTCGGIPNATFRTTRLGTAELIPWPLLTQCRKARPRQRQRLTKSNTDGNGDSNSYGNSAPQQPQPQQQPRPPLQRRAQLQLLQRPDPRLHRDLGPQQGLVQHLCQDRRNFRRSKIFGVK